MKKNFEPMKNFYVFEGPDCSGKDTIMKLVREILFEKRISPSVHMTPSWDTPEGRFMDELLHSDKDRYERLHPQARAMMFTADMNQMDPDDSRIRLCSRWALSTFVYQGVEIGNLDDGFELKAAMLPVRQPTATFLFLPNAESLNQRISERENASFSDQDMDLQRDVRQYYEALQSDPVLLDVIRPYTGDVITFRNHNGTDPEYFASRCVEIIMERNA